MANHKIDEFTLIAKALADPNRVRALVALRNRELCVCQIIELLDLAPSTVSKHMSILKHYRRPDDQGTRIKTTLEWVQLCLAESSQLQEDESQIDKILEMEPEQLCQLQKH
jgi:predicted transcriptional regulator